MPTSINKIFVDRLTKNVTKDHVMEIFSVYGTILNINMPLNTAGTFHLGKAEIEYETVEQAEAALKHMDRGQLDGNLLFVDFWKPEMMQVKKERPEYNKHFSNGYRRGGDRRRLSPPRRPIRSSYRRPRSPYNPRDRQRSPPRPYAAAPPRRDRSPYSPRRGYPPAPRPYSPRPAGRPYSPRRRSISRTPPRNRSISRTPQRRRSPSRSRTPPRRSYRSPSPTRTLPRYRRSRSRTPPRRY